MRCIRAAEAIGRSNNDEEIFGELQQFTVVMRSFSTDKFRSDPCSQHLCAADKIVFESYGHRDLFQMHSDKRKAYVKPCVSFDLLKRRRVFKCRICRRCKRAARFWEGHNIDRLGIRHGGALANHGAV